MPVDPSGQVALDADLLKAEDLFFDALYELCESARTEYAQTYVFSNSELRTDSVLTLIFSNFF